MASFSDLPEEIKLLILLHCVVSDLPILNFRCPQIPLHYNPENLFTDLDLDLSILNTSWLFHEEGRKFFYGKNCFALMTSGRRNTESTFLECLEWVMGKLKPMRTRRNNQYGMISNHPVKASYEFLRRLSIHHLPRDYHNSVLELVLEVVHATDDLPSLQELEIDFLTPWASRHRFDREDSWLVERRDSLHSEAQSFFTRHQNGCSRSAFQLRRIGIGGIPVWFTSILAIKMLATRLRLDGIMTVGMEEMTVTDSGTLIPIFHIAHDAAALNSWLDSLFVRDLVLGDTQGNFRPLHWYGL